MVHFALRAVFTVIIPAFIIKIGIASAERRKFAQTSTLYVGHGGMDRWPLTGSPIARLIGCCPVSELKDEQKYLLNRIALEASNTYDNVLCTSFS